MKTATKKIELDWSKLFGFNQVKSIQDRTNSRKAKALIGTKLGTKTGIKPPPV